MLPLAKEWDRKVTFLLSSCILEDNRAPGGQRGTERWPRCKVMKSSEKEEAWWKTRNRYQSQEMKREFG